MLALLSQNLQQYLRDAGGPDSTLKIIRIAQNALRKCSIRTISTLSCPKWSQCDTSAQREGCILAAEITIHSLMHYSGP